MRPFSTTASALRTARNRPAQPRAGARRSTGATGLGPLRPRVEIPVCDPCPETVARDKHLSRGRFLARQDAWDRLAAEFHTAERERHMTPGLLPVAALLASGARADVMAAARGAVQRTEPRRARAVLAALDLAMEEQPDCPATAFVAAMAHVDLARDWRGASPPSALSPQRRDAYDWHMRRAAGLADRYDPFECESPAWAEVRCALLEAAPRPGLRAADDFEDLIDLTPLAVGHYTALGRAMRPKAFGSWEMLERQARRTAERTRDLWGAGGYAWVYIGALEVDAGAERRLDAEYFAEGLHDILARQPGQHMANRLAAFAGLTMGGPARTGSARRRIADSLGWIAQDHLRALHPRVWALAPIPGRAHPAEAEAEDLVRRGRIHAMSSLAEFYAPALENGRRLVFGPDGISLLRDR